jgi:hypothetical protein
VNQCRRLCSIVLMCVVLAGMAAGQVEVTTNHNDAARTGANLSETILNTANVNGSNFSKLFSRPVDGDIYAQPLYLSGVSVAGQGTHDVIYIATEHNSVYAFDAGDPAQSAPLWQVNLGPAVPSGDACQGNSGSPFCSYTDLVPEIGITSTPVIDPATGTLYVVAKTTISGKEVFMLHALDAGSGTEKFGGPVRISATAPGRGAASSGGTVTFDALYHLNRPGLLLLNGVVYVAFGAVGDIPPFHGWLMGYDASTLQQVSVFNASPDGEAAGIWAGGQALAADGHSIFLTTGNGTFDGDSGGRNWGNSFLRLNASQGLAVTDYFTPNNQDYLSAADLDVGGGGPMVLPNMGLVLGVGKDGVLRLVNENQFGKYNAAFNNDAQEFQATRFFLGAPVFWSGPQGPAVYMWGVGDYLKQYGFAAGRLLTTPLSQSTMSASISNSVPLSLSANGAAPDSGIVWATAALQDASGRRHGVLRAFDAGNVSHELWDSTQNSQRDDLGSFSKFTPPTIANGRVYVPTFSRELVVYGLTSGDFNLKMDETVVLPRSQSVDTTVQVIPQANGLTNPLSLSCSGLPAGMSCTFSPASLPAGSTPMQSKLTVSNSSASANNGRFPRALPAAWFLLAGLCVGTTPLAAKRKRRVLWLLVAGLASAGLLLAPSCGGGGSQSPAPGITSTQSNIKLAVVATSGGIAHSRTITVVTK